MRLLERGEEEEVDTGIIMEVGEGAEVELLLGVFIVLLTWRLH